MKKMTVMGSVAKLMVAITMVAPLQGCLVSTGNVKLGDSLSSAFNGLVESGGSLLGSGGKKSWPFIPTDGEIETSKFSDDVMSKAMSQKSVAIGYDARQKSDLKSTHASFKAFMDSAPNMDQWTGAQAKQYVTYLSKMLPAIDPVLLAAQTQGSTSSSIFMSKVKANKGIINANEVFVPAHSLVQVGIKTNCADEGMPRPTSSALPHVSLAPAAFAQVVPVGLAPHLRNVQIAYTNGTSGQSDYTADALIWSLTQVDAFTKTNRTMFQPSNKDRLNRISPNIYQDFNTLNKSMATANGQTYSDSAGLFPPSRESLKKSADYTYASPMATAKARSENTSSNQLEPNIYYNVRNESFVAKVTIFNAGDKDFRVDLSKYSLINDGTAAQQRLVFMGYANNGDKNAIGDSKSVSADIDSLELARMVAMDVTRYSISKGAESLRDLGKNPAFLAHQSSLVKQFGSDVLKKFFRQAPLVSGMIAANEAYTGVDFVSGRNMTGIERGLAALEATPNPGATAEKIAAKLNWSRISSAISAYGDTVRGSIYWDAAGYGLESYKQTLGSTGDYLSNQWSNSQLQSEGQKALMFINGSGAAIDKFIASYALKS
jgi:hypothetical protein